ncbi:MAG TPA: hypothetical protein VFJ64_10955 [Solirubrobacterales bacterium]|nr:hypothetical protein [Solirubrobacterales bacterium]
MSYRRSIKMLGLAVVAAIAAMAFAGAGSASANATLCKVNANPCTSTWPTSATEHTTIVAKSPEAVLSGGLSEKCASETVILVDGSDATAVLGEVTKLAWTGCTGACKEAKTLKLPAGHGTLTPTGSGNGTLLLGETEVELVNCFGVNCIAKAKSPTLTFNGGAIGTANATADNVPVTLSGNVLCGTTGTWNAGGAHGGKAYVVTSVNGVTSGTGIFAEAS